MDNLEGSDNKNMSLNLIAAYGDSESDSDERDGDLSAEGESHGLSIMVLKNNIINACAHGPLSSNQATVSSEVISQPKEAGVCKPQYREVHDPTSSDSTVSASESSDSDLDSDVDSVKEVEQVLGSDDEGAKGGKIVAPHVLGELGLDDLPPIEDLAISLPSQETSLIGTIASVVDKLVVVCAFPDTPPVDLDTVLFLDNGAKVLGKVFDVFGPVKEPHYCIRFNSAQHVLERGVRPGLQVYVAPHSTAHTNYLFLSELVKVKGSDASWLNDVEPPPSQLDFSDDEEERKANRLRKEKKKQSETPTNEEGQGKQTNMQRPSENARSTNPVSRARNSFSPAVLPQPRPQLRPQSRIRQPRPQNMTPFWRPAPPLTDMSMPGFGMPPHVDTRGISHPPSHPLHYMMPPNYMGRGQSPLSYPDPYDRYTNDFRHNQEVIDHFNQNRMNDPNNFYPYFPPPTHPASHLPQGPPRS